MARKWFYVLSNGMIYKFSRKKYLAVLRAIVNGEMKNMDLSKEEVSMVKTEDLSALTPEQAREKYLDVLREEAFGGK